MARVPSHSKAMVRASSPPPLSSRISPVKLELTSVDPSETLTQTSTVAPPPSTSTPSFALPAKPEATAEVELQQQSSLLRDRIEDVERQIEELHTLSSAQLKKLDDTRDDYVHERSRLDALAHIVADLKEELRTKEVKYRAAKSERYSAEKSVEDVKEMARDRKARQGQGQGKEEEKMKEQYKARLKKLVEERREELGRDNDGERFRQSLRHRHVRLP